MARLGRLAHWVAILCAGILVAVGVVIPMMDQEPLSEAFPFFGFLAALSLTIFLAGRGIRYVLGGE